MHDSDWNRTIGLWRNFPSEFVAFDLISAHLRGVVPIGKARSIDVKGDRAFGGIDLVTAKVDARASQQIRTPTTVRRSDPSSLPCRRF